MFVIVPFRKPLTSIAAGYGFAGPSSPDPGTSIAVVLEKRKVCRRRPPEGDCLLRFDFFLRFLAWASWVMASGEAARVRLPTAPRRPRRENDDGSARVKISPEWASTASPSPLALWSCRTSP